MFVHTRDSNGDLRRIRIVLQLNQVLNDNREPCLYRRISPHNFILLWFGIGLEFNDCSILNLEMTRVMLNLYVVLVQVYFKIRSILLRSFA